MDIIIIILLISTFLTLVVMMLFDQSEIGWEDACKVFLKRLAILLTLLLIVGFIALSLAGVIF